MSSTGDGLSRAGPPLASCFDGRRRSPRTVREITVCGSLREMGEQHGEAAADLIAQLFATRFELLVRQMAGAFPKRRISDIELELENWTTLLFSEIASHLPDVATEVRGVARGCGLKPWELIVAGGYTDVLGGLVAPRSQYPTATCECTVLAIPRVRGGGAVIAGTWDSHASASPALVLLRRQPASGNSTLTLTTAGWPAQQGVTSAGLTFATNNLRPRHGGPGIVYIGALAHLLSAASIDAARETLLRFQYCSGHFYPIGDHHGRLLLLETSNGAKAELACHRGVVAHTNHYLAPELQDDNPRDEDAANSTSRLQRAQALTADTPPHELRERMWTILRDHGEGGPGICRHGEGHETRSCAAFVIDARGRSVEFTDGPACCGPRRTALLST